MILIKIEVRSHRITGIGDFRIVIENAIVFLVRSSENDIIDLNKCLKSLELHLPNTSKNADLIFFHESSFEDFFPKIVIPEIFMSNAIQFCEVDLGIPAHYENSLKEKIPEYFPHPTHGKGPVAFGHVGFSIGYRSMCRFFSFGIFQEDVFRNKKYNYILRLDTDSLFIKGNAINLFEWVNSNSIIYGFIESAIQWDHPKVSRNFKRTALKALLPINWLYFLRALLIPKSRMYYTNFELMKVDFFQSSRWDKFSKHLDSTGGFYLYRWGDAIVRYLGVNSMVKKSARCAIPAGIVYQHGGQYSSGDRQRLRARLQRNASRLGNRKKLTRKRKK